MHSKATPFHARVTGQPLDRELTELDNRPAKAVYNDWCTELGVADMDQWPKTTLYPLARVSTDEVTGIKRHFVLHPAGLEHDTSIQLFAAVQPDESLVLLQGSRDSLVNELKTVVSNVNDELTASGVLTIYCGGAALELCRWDEDEKVPEGTALGRVAAGICDAMPASAAMAGGCTFGEQGPLLSAGNCHANLM
jgi:hypothetical protein